MEVWYIAEITKKGWRHTNRKAIPVNNYGGLPAYRRKPITTGKQNLKMDIMLYRSNGSGNGKHTKEN
jgi:hypothetical protein